MGYVDLRRHRDERDTRKPFGPLPSHPYLLLMAGFIFGTLCSPVFYIAFNGPDPVGILLLLIAAVALLGYLGRLMLKPDRAGARPRPGAEKQLLLAILDAGGITPVEAALKTSLTVDEADDVLTRLADRGHLLVHSRDGALLYALPGRHTSSRHAADSIST